MKLHICSECQNPLPAAWRPVATRTVQSVCPNCALKHMRTKSKRRKALRHSGRKRLASTSAN